MLPDQNGTEGGGVQDFLARPETFGLAPGDRVERIETHASVIFLAGERAYKLKKPIKLPYLDFSSLERRLACCRQELAVNRTFSPDIYLGLGGIVTVDGSMQLSEAAADGDLGEDGLLEPLVVMQRFDGGTQLDRVAEREGLNPVLADRLGIMAAELMAKAEPRRVDWPAEFAAVVAESMEEIEGAPEIFDPARTADLRGRMADWLAKSGTPLARRAGQGRVRRCHGDLHLQNIFCRDGRPMPFDALEFDEALATTDVLYDLAFLLMDMQARGYPEAAARTLCVALALAEDYGTAGLLPGYMATRAIIRAKILATQIGQHSADEQAARTQARHYFDLAARFLDPPSRRLLAVGGLSGSGKTTCAFALARQLGPHAVVIRSDVTRKHLEGLDLFEKAPRSSYNPESSARVYGRILADAETALKAGAGVVLDGVFAHGDQRDACSRLARDLGIPFSGLWLEAPAGARVNRIAGRANDASDADGDVARQQEAWVSGRIGWTRIEAAGPPGVVAERAAQAAGLQPGSAPI